MNPKVFDELRGIVYEQSGIRIQDGKETMVSARIGQRLRELEIPDDVGYLEYLKDQLDQEIVALLDVISTNVTSFYRESEHFDYITGWMNEWLGEGQKRFRVWCAASSTGEEPYTIAITLREAIRKAGVKTDTRILATDISTRVLNQAQAGLYEAKKVEAVPEPLLRRYFDAKQGAKGRCYEARQELKDMILFKRLNLSAPPFPMRGPMDFVICRNVMIYFDEPVRTALINAFHDLLRPGGYLITGKSEGLTRNSKSFDRAGPAIYRKGA